MDYGENKVEEREGGEIGGKAVLVGDKCSRVKMYFIPSIGGNVLGTM